MVPLPPSRVKLPPAPVVNVELEGDDVQSRNLHTSLRSPAFQAMSASRARRLKNVESTSQFMQKSLLPDTAGPSSMLGSITQSTADESKRRERLSALCSDPSAAPKELLLSSQQMKQNSEDIGLRIIAGCAYSMTPAEHYGQAPSPGLLSLLGLPDRTEENWALVAWSDCATRLRAVQGLPLDLEQDFVEDDSDTPPATSMQSDSTSATDGNDSGDLTSMKVKTGRETFEASIFDDFEMFMTWKDWYSRLLKQICRHCVVDIEDAKSVNARVVVESVRAVQPGATAWAAKAFSKPYVKVKDEHHSFKHKMNKISRKSNSSSKFKNPIFNQSCTVPLESVYDGIKVGVWLKSRIAGPSRMLAEVSIKPEEHAPAPVMSEVEMKELGIRKIMLRCAAYLQPSDHALAKAKKIQGLKCVGVHPAESIAAVVRNAMSKPTGVSAILQEDALSLIDSAFMRAGRRKRESRLTILHECLARFFFEGEENPSTTIDYSNILPMDFLWTWGHVDMLGDHAESPETEGTIFETRQEKMLENQCKTCGKALVQEWAVEWPEMWARCGAQCVDFLVWCHSPVSDEGRLNSAIIQTLKDAMHRRFEDITGICASELNLPEGLPAAAYLALSIFERCLALFKDMQSSYQIILHPQKLTVEAIFECFKVLHLRLEKLLASINESNGPLPTSSTLFPRFSLAVQGIHAILREFASRRENNQENHSELENQQLNDLEVSISRVSFKLRLSMASWIHDEVATEVESRCLEALSSENWSRSGSFCSSISDVFFSAISSLSVFQEAFHESIPSVMLQVLCSAAIRTAFETHRNVHNTFQQCEDANDLLAKAIVTITELHNICESLKDSSGAAWQKLDEVCGNWGQTLDADEVAPFVKELQSAIGRSQRHIVHSLLDNVCEEVLDVFVEATLLEGFEEGLTVIKTWFESAPAMPYFVNQLMLTELQKACLQCLYDTICPMDCKPVGADFLSDKEVQNLIGFVQHNMQQSNFTFVYTVFSDAEPANPETSSPVKPLGDSTSGTDVLDRRRFRLAHRLMDLDELHEAGALKSAEIVKSRLQVIRQAGAGAAFELCVSALDGYRYLCACVPQGLWADMEDQLGILSLAVRCHFGYLTSDECIHMWVMCRDKTQHNGMVIVTSERICFLPRFFRREALGNHLLLEDLQTAAAPSEGKIELGSTEESWRFFGVPDVLNMLEVVVSSAEKKGNRALGECVRVHSGSGAPVKLHISSIESSDFDYGSSTVEVVVDDREFRCQVGNTLTLVDVAEGHNICFQLSAGRWLWTSPVLRASIRMGSQFLSKFESNHSLQLEKVSKNNNRKPVTIHFTTQLVQSSIDVSLKRFRSYEPASSGRHFVVSVSVISVGTLKPLAHGAYPDSYVVVTVGSSKQRTRIVRSSQNPVWSENFEFMVQNLESLSQNSNGGTLVEFQLVISSSGLHLGRRNKTVKVCSASVPIHSDLAGSDAPIPLLLPFEDCQSLSDGSFLSGSICVVEQ